MSEQPMTRPVPVGPERLADEEQTRPRPPVGARYVKRDGPDAGRVVTVTRVWVADDGHTAVAYSWRDDRPGQCGSACPLDVFERAYVPESEHRAAAGVETLRARVAELEAGNAGLDDLRIRALDKNDQLRALLALATEFRLGEPGYSLLVRLAPDGRGWAVLEAQRTSRGRRAWTESGWQHGLVAGGELFCWPSARAAVAEARRILSDAVVHDESAPVEDPHDGAAAPRLPDQPRPARDGRCVMASPNPNGCRWCGTDQRPHAQQWKQPVGWHKWTPPTQPQIKARMLARRAARKGGA